jgi:hypothetical protein
MIKMNYVILGCMVSCSLVAMDRDGLTPEQRLKLGRKLEQMEPNNSRQLQLWRQNNALELEIENKRNLTMLGLETDLQLKMLYLQEERKYLKAL